MPLRILLPLALSACLLLPGRAAHPLTSADTVLAIDASAFERIDGMSLSLNEARKRPENPVLRNRPTGPDAWRAGFPWVLLENGLFRMWYLARDGAGAYFTCYAESRDGIHWERPALGIIEHGGSKATNICYTGHTLFPQVFRDDRATDPARRYVATVYGEITGDYFNDEQRKQYGQRQPSVKCFAFSPDGLHWSEDHTSLFPIRAKVEGGTLLRVDGEWLMVHQQNVHEYPEVHPFSRFLSASASKDLINWKLGAKPAFYFNPKYNGALQTHVTPGYQSYGNVIVGAQGLFYDNVELIDHETDLILLLSNDGRSWRQPKPAQPLSYLLRRGQPDDWDRSFIVQGNLVNSGDKTLLFYNGSQWGNVDADGIQIGVAELPLDGYGSLAPAIGWDFGKAGPFVGTVTSKPIMLAEPGLRLYLNVRGSDNEADRVEVELSDGAGAPFPGFTFAESDNLNTDSVGVPACWHGQTDLSKLSGQAVTVKVRIHAQNPQRTGKIRRLEPQFHALYFSRPKLWLNRAQTVFAAGVERQHSNDPLIPVLTDLDARSRRRATLQLTALTPDAATLIASGTGEIQLSSKRLESAQVGEARIPARDGLVTFTMRDRQSVALTFKPGGAPGMR